MFFVCLIMLVSGFVLTGCNKSDDVIRIHIRANSNMDSDQSVKLKVRDELISYITPLIALCDNSIEVKNVLNDNLQGIKQCADSVLLECGYDYKSIVKLSNEYFPSRDYNGNTFPADYYDALIVELGSGTGDNWWCVAYPPLCFVGNDLGTNDVKYKSKLLELINKFFN